MPFLNLEAINKWAAKKFFGAKDRKKIWLKLAKMLENGVPILQALESIRQRREKSKGPNDFAVLAMNDWALKMKGGHNFSSAVKEWIPHQESLLLMAGDNSGDLKASFIAATDVMTTIAKIKSAVIAGLLYPSILILLGLGTSYMFGVKIFPMFFKIAAEDRWTGQAVYAIKFSHFIQDWLWLVSILIVAAIVGFVYSLPRWDGALRVKLDTMMPFSLYRTIVGSTWLVALAAMINSGERIEDALVSMKSGAGPWLKNRIDRCLAKMRTGQNMGDALRSAGDGFPDNEIIDDLGVYSQISGFDKALASLGTEWSEESVKQVEVQAKVMFVAGIVIVSMLLGFLIAGLISMQLQLGDVIRTR